MGKRSNFERRKSDFYETFDPVCRDTLLPHIAKGVKYWEPCAGRLALVELLADHAECVIATDKSENVYTPIEGVYRVDALDVCESDIPSDVDCIITNPPWTRIKSEPVLHDMIEHFRVMRPTWLLFDADWMFTLQSSPMMKFCHTVVAIGRVKWIRGSKTKGKDNCAWYLFDNHEAPTEFIGRFP
ncbi:MAG: class I SAM-dependent methyltransferase [Pseudomonadota bacterium]